MGIGKGALNCVMMVEEEEGGGKGRGGAVLKPLSKKSVERFKKEQSRRGVVYLSRIPPFFKPNKIRSLLGEVGRIDRVYLRAESDGDRERGIELCDDG
mmetsp:Transcript_37792/g.150710  ORF Transcript_37792/g.150710 Transcript_37792/m.150710 type:complete len:98 (+) Transcript_37792:36-329(+)